MMLLIECRMCTSATYRADIGCRHTADSVPTSIGHFFLVKTSFSWLLKSRANKIGKGKKQDYALISTTLLIPILRPFDFSNFEESAVLVCTVAGTGWKQPALNWDGLCGRLHILFWHGDAMLPLKILAPHPQMTSTVVQEAWISFTFLSITCKRTKLIKRSHIFCWVFLTSLWLVIVITFWHQSRFCYDIVKIVFKYQHQSFL